MTLSCVSPAPDPQPVRLALPGAIDPQALVGWRPEADLFEIGGETMGTLWRVRLAAPAGRFVPGELVGAIAHRLEVILAQMSHWRVDSALGRFNRAPAGHWAILPADFARVIACALTVHAQSDGAFDPAIGRLVCHWGHGPDLADTPPGDRTDARALDAARRASGCARLAWEPQTARLRQPGGVWLDLSGIAKGFAVDALAALLRERGIGHALVEIGGEFAGLGLRPDGDPWWVDLDTPVMGIAPLRVALHQLAVATSGDYVRGRHTIDPRSGQPVGHALAVSVVHASAMWADAWASALGVLEPAAAKRACRTHDLAARLLLREGGLVREWISPALVRMIDT
ncbi:FAD:protein FMN transferase [Novosphingobium sp. 1949]|uniref:FAD:protein FMN transferase n=1 Tax=Novosphingobium organovorum TaxID=2930092 RepID=A0ABT0BJ47_9SPHN|nr:FAD:protein FMN transferase [Novosphingobium organovorum]MCJ2185060.1 FAD:protein FMN transferase [Novosphingobium organovorum]